MARLLRLAILSGAHPHAASWAKVIRTMGDVEVAATWDDNPERGRAMAEKAGGAVFEPNLAALLARTDIDAVAIASEISKHADLTVAAAQAGKHIMCEKPMACTLADCDRMIGAVQRSDVKYYQIFPMRWDPVNQRIREIVTSGQLGRISLIRKRHGHFYGLKWQESDPDIWFVKPEMAGAGAFLDEGMHAIDWMRWIFGEPVSVMAQIDTVLTPFAVDDLGAAIYRFANRAFMVLHASWNGQMAWSSPIWIDPY